MSDTADTPTPAARRGRRSLLGKPMTAAQRKKRQRDQARAKLYGASGGEIDLTTISTYDLSAELSKCIENDSLYIAMDILNELSARVETRLKKQAQERDKLLSDGQDNDDSTD